MQAKRLTDPGFKYRDHLNTNLQDTFAKAQRELGEVRIVKLPRLVKSNEAPRAEEKQNG